MTAYVLFDGAEPDSEIIAVCNSLESAINRLIYYFEYDRGDGFDGVVVSVRDSDTWTINGRVSITRDDKYMATCVVRKYMVYEND